MKVYELFLAVPLLLIVSCSTSQPSESQTQKKTSAGTQSLAEIIKSVADVPDICTTVSETQCKLVPVNTEQLEDAFVAMLSSEFASVFEQQATGKNGFQSSKLQFPSDNWVFLNSTEYTLPSSVTVGTQQFKQVTLDEIKAKGITHFLDITDIKQYANTYVFYWTRGMEADFGESAAEKTDTGYRVVELVNYHSSSGARNYMKGIFAGVQCVDETQLAYYVNYYRTGVCP